MTTNPSPSPLVQTEWLAAHLEDADVRIVDVRFRSRAHRGRGNLVDDRDGYVAGHIPGAVFVGMVTELSDPDHPIPDMLVTPEQFAQVMGRLGIGDDTLVVAYDGMGLPLAAARLWWALSYYGHDRVRVLDGGIHKWQAEERPLSTDVPAPKVVTFTPRPRPSWLAIKDDVASALGHPGIAIVDCLFSELYHSTESHLWGDRPGHIPSAVNIPYLANADPALATTTAAERDRLLAAGRTLTFGSPDTLAALYAACGVTPDRAVITYCGRGYSAACGLLALKVLGYQDVRLYDGSWTEWSADPQLPVEVTPTRSAAGVGNT